MGVSFHSRPYTVGLGPKLHIDSTAFLLPRGWSPAVPPTDLLNLHCRPCNTFDDRTLVLVAALLFTFPCLLHSFSHSRLQSGPLVLSPPRAGGAPLSLLRRHWRPRGDAQLRHDILTNSVSLRSAVSCPYPPSPARASYSHVSCLPLMWRPPLSGLVLSPLTSLEVL